MEYKICKKNYETTKIPIKKKNVENLENINYQHSLKQNLFDPTKSSPPNIFIIKLYARIYADNYTNTKFDNFKNE
jgi:hypothetical protein